MSKTSWLLSSTALLGLIGPSAADAAEVTPSPGAPAQVDLSAAAKPAVAGFNAKLDLRGGIEDDVEFLAAVGSLSMPLGDPFGLQIDGLLGTLDGELAGAGAAHLFWRNPDVMQLGVYGEVGHAEANDAGTSERAAAEAEFYFDAVTVSALIGGQFGDLGEGFFSKESISFYATDDLRLYGTHRYLPEGEGHSGSLGAEWLTGFGGNGVALFGEGSVDEDGDWGVNGGVRVYFGAKAPLIRQHREYDPPDHFDLFLKAAASAKADAPQAPLE